MTDDCGAPARSEVADYVAEMAGQLAIMAQRAGFASTAATLVRAQLSALADLRSAQLVNAAPDDAA